MNTTTTPFQRRPLNKSAILAAIKADGVLCEGALVNGTVKGCDNPGHCAMGAILFHHGMTNEELVMLPHGLYNLVDCLGAPNQNLAHLSPRVRDVRIKAQKILMELGLTRNLIRGIIINNDYFHDRAPTLEAWKARAQWVMDKIKGMPE